MVPYFKVGFTDIDYRVFRNAAELVWQGKSPFDLPEYRYTPFLSWILIPSIFFPDYGFAFLASLSIIEVLGKFLFCLVDTLIGWITFRIISKRSAEVKEGCRDTSKYSLLAVSIFWLLNPFVAIISARGNADSIVCFATLCAFYLLDTNKLVLSALIHGGLAVHFKIYPLIYLPSIFLSQIKQASLHSDSGITITKFIWNCFKNKNGFIYILV